MKKLFISLLVISTGALFMANAFYSPSTDGSPIAQTGSPSDGNDCSSCHKTKAKFVDGMITSNIPAEGYTSGKTYIFTTILKGNAKATKFGFQISPQNAKGKLIGKIIATNTLETKVIGNGKYINQIKDGVNGKGSKTWSFEWIAPDKGSGEVVFYGSYLIGGNPESVYNSKLILTEKK